MLWVHVTILLSLFVLGYLIGRMIKMNKYEEQIKNLHADKMYWRDIANRQRAPEPPDL